MKTPLGKKVSRTITFAMDMHKLTNIQMTGQRMDVMQSNSFRIQGIRIVIEERDGSERVRFYHEIGDAS